MRAVMRLTGLLIKKSLVVVILVILLSPVAKIGKAAEVGEMTQLTITKITDGDSLRAGDIRIRLHGIDAPEMRQQCDNNGSYACGKQAQAYLAAFLGRRATLRCAHIDTDRYKRLIMRCYHRGIDIGAAMVRAGWALAYRRYAKDYIADEQEAKAAKRGLWAGTFQTPEAWRRAN